MTKVFTFLIAATFVQMGSRALAEGITCDEVKGYAAECSAVKIKFDCDKRLQVVDDEKSTCRILHNAELESISESLNFYGIVQSSRILSELNGGQACDQTIKGNFSSCIDRLQNIVDSNKPGSAANPPTPTPTSGAPQ